MTPAYHVAFSAGPRGLQVGGLGAGIKGIKMHGLGDTAAATPATSLTGVQWALIGGAAFLFVGGGTFLGIRSSRKRPAVGGLADYLVSCRPALVRRVGRKPKRTRRRRR